MVFDVFSGGLGFVFFFQGAFERASFTRYFSGAHFVGCLLCGFRNPLSTQINTRNI